MYGILGWNRTTDLQFRKLPLCPLSYEDMNGTSPRSRTSPCGFGIRSPATGCWYVVPVRGIEPRSRRYEGLALPLSYTGMVTPVGIEPTTRELKTPCSNQLSYEAVHGDRGWTRTTDLKIRNQLLCPTELPGHEMVPPQGIEPWTPGLRIPCSNRLS